MKPRYLLLSLLMPLLVANAFPAAGQAQTKAPANSEAGSANLKNNTIFWQQGRLVQHLNGKLLPVQAPVTYANGTVVLADGKVQTPDGNTQVLQQKEAVNPQGRVVLAADDLFAHHAILAHEREVVGDTETKIVVIDGKIASVAHGKEKQVYGIGQEEKIQLLEQMVQLLQQRSALLEDSLSKAELKSIQGHYQGLNKQLSIVENQLKTQAPALK